MLTLGSGEGVLSFGAPSGTRLLRSSTLPGWRSREPFSRLLGRGSAPCWGFGAGRGI